MRIELSLRHVEVLALELQPPLLLDESTSVGDTIRAMRGQGLGYALIASEKRLSGIFTERDVFLSVIGDPAVLPQAVTGFMTRDPITVSENDPIWQVVSRMHEGGFRQVPVLDDQGRGLLARGQSLSNDVNLVGGEAGLAELRRQVVRHLGHHAVPGRRTQRNDVLVYVQRLALVILLVVGAAGVRHCRHGQ